MLPQSAPHERQSAAPRLVCYRCFKPQVACICASIEQVANQTDLLILQHPRERFHAVGTARIARLGFAQVRIEPCAPWVTDAARRPQLPPQSALLYPSSGARDLGAVPLVERPRHLVILDGTWFHAKKIYDAHHWLHDLPHVRLTPPELSRYRIRPQPNARCVATLEAIVFALQILEPQTRGLEGLLQSFSAMVDRQAAYTPHAAGPLPPRDNPGSPGGTILQ